jgi:hypothetical protein
MYRPLRVPQLITLAPFPVVGGVGWEEAAFELPSSETRSGLTVESSYSYQYFLLLCKYCFPGRTKINVRRALVSNSIFLQAEKDGLEIRCKRLWSNTNIKVLVVYMYLHVSKLKRNSQNKYPLFWSTWRHIHKWCSQIKLHNFLKCINIRANCSIQILKLIYAFRLSSAYICAYNEYPQRHLLSSHMRCWTPYSGTRRGTVRATERLSSK